MLYDRIGNRKYLIPSERRKFMAAAKLASPEIETFCLTLACTGARISEVLALTPEQIDYPLRAVTLECLKKRKPGVFRTVPAPDALLDRLDVVHQIRAKQKNLACLRQRIWPWSRTTAWMRVKRVMADAGVSGGWAVPKGLRHGLGVESAVHAKIPLNIIQRWLGHSRIETTAIYTNAVGSEERALAERLWDASWEIHE